MTFRLFDSRPSPRQVDVALLAIRVIAGIIFIAHGWQKYGMGVSNVAGFFAQTGIPLAGIAAPLVTGLELVGGALLVIGLLTRPLAMMFAIDMASATLFVHAKNGFAGPGGMEFTLMLCTVAVALAIAGGGAYSVDAILDKRKAA